MKYLYIYSFNLTKRKIVNKAKHKSSITKRIPKISGVVVTSEICRNKQNLVLNISLTNWLIDVVQHCCNI